LDCEVGVAGGYVGGLGEDVERRWGGKEGEYRVRSSGVSLGEVLVGVVEGLKDVGKEERLE